MSREKLFLNKQINTVEIQLKWMIKLKETLNIIDQDMEFSWSFKDSFSQLISILLLPQSPENS